MNEPGFLFSLYVMVLDEGRRTYSLCRICVFSMTILADLRSTCFSYRAVRQGGFRQVTLLLMFAMRCKIFLTDVPIPTVKRKSENTSDTRRIKHRQKGAINVKQQSCLRQ